MKKVKVHRLTDKDLSDFYKKERDNLAKENKQLKNKVTEIRRNAGSIVGNSTNILKDNR